MLFSSKFAAAAGVSLSTINASHYKIIMPKERKQSSGAVGACFIRLWRARVVATLDPGEPTAIDFLYSPNVT